MRLSARRRPVALKGLPVFLIVLSVVLPAIQCAAEEPGWRERREERRERRREFFGRGSDKAAASEGAAGVEGEYPVGFRVIQVDAPNREGKLQPIQVAVWYPAEGPATSYRYKLGQNQLATNLAVKGAARPGPFPLIINSHGATGSGLNGPFLSERLAAQGFVVAAPDYTDEYYGARIDREVPRPTLREMRGMAKWLRDIKDFQLNKGGKAYRKKLSYRPKQAVAAIDKLMAESANPASPFHGRIDAGKVGLVGHSFGAWTSMLVGGLDPAYADPRVKAIVALSGPCNDSVYESGEIKKIKVPIMFMFGGDEPKVGRASDRALLYDRANSPRFLLEVEGADHFAFSGGIRDEYRTVREYLVKDPRRATIVQYTEAFFEHYLLGNPAAKDFLDQQAPTLVSYVKEY